MDGVATVRVYSANSKTVDGYNTFIFRRAVERSIKKLAWAPVVDATGNPLPVGEVGVQVGRRPYYDQRVVAKFKADTEVTFLHEQSRIGVSAFEQVYDNRFRLILQGVELCYQKMVEYAV